MWFHYRGSQAARGATLPAPDRASPINLNNNIFINNRLRYYFNVSYTIATHRNRMTDSQASASARAASPPGLARRLAACLYDGLLLVAVLMVAAAAWVGLSGATVPPGDWLFRAYLLAVTALFFGAFWRRGETLGMRAWKLRVVATDGQPPGWGRALLRFAAATLSWTLLGLGFWWVLVDRERLAWHDRLSGTRLVLRS